MARKDRKIVLICQCLVNPYCRVHLLGQNFPLSRELMDYLLGRRVGVIQYLCPETTAMGLMRNPQGRQQYDNIFFRDHCKELLKTPLLMVREFMRNRYRLCCFIGLENSPTCSVRWAQHKTNRYGTESPTLEEGAGGEAMDLMGIMAEILSEELARDGVETKFLEFPALSEPGSEKRNRFWRDLEEALEPPGET
jgi:predicted secreted protein